MLSIASATSAPYYFRYLAGGQQSCGEWAGSACRRLRLPPRPTEQALTNLMDGRAPDGRSPLPGLQVQGYTDGRTHRKAWDLTFSEPPSPADLRVQLPPDLRDRHDQALTAANAWGVRHLEQEAAVVRLGKGGRGRAAADLLVASFLEFTNRLHGHDPHLHNVVVASAGLRDSGAPTFRKLESKSLFREMKTAGTLMRLELARELEARLGVRTVRAVDEQGKKLPWFEVEGVPRRANGPQTRRGQVLSWLKERGLTGARAARQGALATRPRKTKAPPDLLARWQAELSARGFGPEEALALTGRAVSRDTAREVRELHEETRKALSRTDKPWGKRDLIRTMAEESFGRGLGANAVLQEAERFLSSRQAHSVGRYRGEDAFKTREQLTTEDKLLQQVERLRGRRRGLKPRTVEQVLAEHVRLKEEDKGVIRRVTARESGLISVVAGAGGTLLALRRTYERSRYAVLAASATGTGVEQLKGAGLEGSRTVSELLRDLKPRKLSRRTFHGKQFSSLTAMARYATKARKPRLKLTKRSVILLTEADAAHGKDLAELLRLARKAKAKVVLVGGEESSLDTAALRRDRQAARGEHFLDPPGSERGKPQRLRPAREAVGRPGQGRSDGAAHHRVEKGRGGRPREARRQGRRGRRPVAQHAPAAGAAAGRGTGEGSSSGGADPHSPRRPGDGDPGEPRLRAFGAGPGDGGFTQPAPANPGASA